MTTTIPDLWPEEISVEVLTPLAILRYQAERFRDRMKGLLKAKATTITKDHGSTRHQLDVIAPLLGDYRHRILAAWHNQDIVYPVWVAADCFEDENGELDEREVPIAATQAEFVTMVGEVLNSRPVKSVIDSLLARSNEKAG